MVKRIIGTCDTMLTIFSVPITESLSLFTVLQRKGVESKLLYFEQEGKYIENGRNIIQMYDEMIAWVDRFTKPSNNTK